MKPHRDDLLKKWKSVLEEEACKRNRLYELTEQRPDPLMVAHRYRNESVSLFCALFGYGNAKAIVNFLDRIDFSLLSESDEVIKKYTRFLSYRFQNGADIAALMIALKRLRCEASIESLVYEGYKKEHNMLEGLRLLIKRLKALYPHQSNGYRFLIGSEVPRDIARCGAYKRYMMFFRWMVRCDMLDMGLWRKIDKKDLLIPLDTHTASVSRRMGLLRRKSNDMKAVLELTQVLRCFDPSDPIKYDFALYRIGQERIDTLLSRESV